MSCWWWRRGWAGSGWWVVVSRGGTVAVWRGARGTMNWRIERIGWGMALSPGPSPKTLGEGRRRGWGVVAGGDVLAG